MKPHFTEIESNQFEFAIMNYYDRALKCMTESDDHFRAAVIFIPCMVQKLKQTFPMEVSCGYTPIEVNTYLKKDSQMIHHIFCDTAKLAMKHLEMLANMMRKGAGYAAFTDSSRTDIGYLNRIIHATPLDMTYVQLRYMATALWGVQTWNDIVGSYIYHTYHPDRLY